jgi:hypothetical protein
MPFATSNPMAGVNRRQFLQAAGVSCALPLLESLACPGFAVPRVPRRMIAVCAGLGVYPDNFFPTEAGRSYQLTPYLGILKDYRNAFTVCSGLSHPEVGGGHAAEDSFLTAAPHPGQASFHNAISLDQLALEKLKPDTRLPALVLSTMGSSISFNRAGVQLPPCNKPSALFASLFLNGTPNDVERQVQRLKDRQSVLDAVQDQARQLQQQISSADKQRLDQYFTAVREVEERLQSAQEWAKRPKPQVAAKPPQDIANVGDVVGRTRLMLDLAALAFQTDSTRIITLKIDVVAAVPPIDGVQFDHHNLSHHGKDPEKVRQLQLIETQQMTALRDFLAKLRQVQEGAETLLDRTIVFYGSNLGNASSHDTRNLPILIAGGGFKHGQHLAFDQTNNTPLGKLYVTMLQRLGAEVDAFGSAKGRLTGLEPA